MGKNRHPAVFFILNLILVRRQAGLGFGVEFEPTSASGRA